MADSMPWRRREVGSAGSDTDTDDEDARYYLQSRHDNDEWASVCAGGSTRRNSSPARSFGSDKTISDDDDARAVAVAREVVVFPCAVCRREFSSSKAVNGHMRVHAQHAAKEEKMMQVDAVNGNMRVHARATKEEKMQVDAVVVSAAVPPAEEVGDCDSVPVSAAIVVAGRCEDDDTVTPVQSACGSNSVGSSAKSSVDPSPSGAAAPAPEQVPVAMTPAAAPEQAVPVAPTPPAAPQQATSIPLMVPAASPQQRVPDSPLHIANRSDQSTTRRQTPSGNSQRGFTCTEPDCNRWFPTHQGLGGHAAGHKNRRIAEAAAAAVAAGMDPQEHTAYPGGDKPPKLHACKVCGAEYKSGVSLGGHMRKHYSGKPIVPRKRLCLYNPERVPAMEAPIVAPPLALNDPEQVAPVVEAAALQPPQAVPGTVRLFGVNIPKKEEEPPVDEPMDEQ